MVSTMLKITLKSTSSTEYGNNVSFSDLKKEKLWKEFFWKKYPVISLYDSSSQL